MSARRAKAKVKDLLVFKMPCAPDAGGIPTVKPPVTKRLPRLALRPPAF